MSEALPPRPHLNWLKNRAKEELQRLRANDPAARLADAQLAVARAHGFVSWGKLKAHIHALRVDENALPPVAIPLNADLVKAFAEAIRGDIETVRQMLDVYPQLANSAVDGHTVLHHAAGENRAAAIGLLIERGADPNARWAGLQHTPLSWAVTCDWPEACRALVEGGAKVDLFCASGMGLLDAVRSHFDEAGHLRPGASISGSSRRRDDGTYEGLSGNPRDVISDALYIACRTGHTEVALYLLDRGADANFRGYMGATCFHWAYFGGGDPRLISALAAHGGDARAIYADRRCTPRGFGILVASAWGWVHYVKRILATDASLANLAEGGSTPLHEAARNGNAEIVKLLLENGADRGVVDGDGKTPLDRAAESNHEAVVSLLKLGRPVPSS